MDKENLQQLANIYNNLLSVHTNGEDSFVMTDCMRALFQFIQKCAQEANEKKEE